MAQTLSRLRPAARVKKPFPRPPAGLTLPASCAMKNLAVAFLASAWLLYAAAPAARAISPATPAPAATPDAEEQAAENILRSFRPQEGKITLQGGLADLDLPGQFRYLNAADSRKLLVDVWGNPPHTADEVIGMIIPTDFYKDEEHQWAATVTFNDAGYIKDEEPNYDELLKHIQQAREQANEQRVKDGYLPLHIVGWAEPPHYDKAAKKLYWAKELQSGDNPRHGLNYDIRILGRRGALQLSIISGMDQLAQINNLAPSLLSTVNFNAGHQYADFNPKTDKVAAYGLAGLIGGGLVLAKVGGLKYLIGLLIAAKKFLVIGVVAVGGFFKRLFGGGTKVNTDRPGPPTGAA